MPRAILAGALLAVVLISGIAYGAIHTLAGGSELDW